ncbi:EamA family transporter [Roseomonas eburnea]|uniref:EamA family transporter n=1 Tax=Neoroseomonas eburnea TaxID=1346889 RepID=A0A9X9XJE7_9PROT|nr:EamA family transporter [Neoroseomonas eburnea]MBR0683833.1 EamA family transporter [Neoroseomonas eburnea]
MRVAEPTAQRPLVDRVPPHAFFLISAVFHYLGPSFAVLLFANFAPAGVAWLRIASAGLVFALWRRPWRALAALRPRDRWIIAAMGAVLAAMNTIFYEAIARLPLATVGAIEFLGPIALAAWGVRTGRNLLALLLAVGGVWLLTDVRLAGEPLGYLFAFLNCGLFVLYIVLGHSMSAGGAGVSGVDRLALSMIVASIAALPFGWHEATPAFADPLLLAAAVGVGISSSVIPYVCDQLAMRRLPRASFALLLSLLPASAAAIGVLVLGQIPTPVEIAGIGLVILGVALHRSER